jgi:hypothetical protein
MILEREINLLFSNNIQDYIKYRKCKVDIKNKIKFVIIWR